MEYNDNEKFIIWLDSLGLPRKKCGEILKLSKNLIDIYNNYSKYNEQIKTILTDKYYNKFIDRLGTMTECVEELNRKHIKAVTCLSDSYPEKLLEISPSVLVLYAVGDVGLLKSDKIVAIVGTRKPSRYGKEMAEYFSVGLAENGIVTISGLAYGVDTLVARKTLDAKGKTIAVLGGGLDEIYPLSNTTLAKEIVRSGGLIVSEYRIGVRPTQYSFPERNRIISGISDGVLVVEAGKNSGSLITANHALEQNKSLFVVPANINSKQSEGSNLLIKELPHSAVFDLKTVLAEFGVEFVEEKNNSQEELTEDEKLIYNLILGNEICFDDLVEATKFDPTRLNILLTQMEIEGKLKKLPSNYYTID